MGMSLRDIINDYPKLRKKVACLDKILAGIEGIQDITDLDLNELNYELTLSYLDSDGNPQTQVADLSALNTASEFIPNIVVNTFADLPVSAQLFEFALVQNSTGTQWLPGSLGGTYRSSGLYYWNGSAWINDNDQVFGALQTLIDSLATTNANLAQEITDRTNADAAIQVEVDALKVSTGWWTISDTTFTSVSPQTIPANTRTLLQVNSDSVIEAFGANGALASAIWDDTTNKLTPLASGDSYLFRLSLTANPTLNNRNFTVDLDIGGTQGIIFERSTRLARGANNDTKISMTNSIFALGTFIANGGEIYITCDGDVDIFDISLFIQKVTQDD